jgi:hypothetical protein
MILLFIGIDIVVQRLLFSENGMVLFSYVKFYSVLQIPKIQRRLVILLFCILKRR